MAQEDKTTDALDGTDSGRPWTIRQIRPIRVLKTNTCTGCSGSGLLLQIRYILPIRVLERNQ